MEGTILSNSVTEYACHRFADHTWFQVIVNEVLRTR